MVALSKDIVSEVYGVLMVLGIAMDEPEVLEALKKTGFDDSVSHFILKTALDVQEITRHHNDKLNEISSQVQITPDQTELLAKAYLKAQGISTELIEVVYLFHSFQTSLDIAEQVILNDEKHSLSTEATIQNIRELGKLDKASAESMYITAMTRMGKPYVLPAKRGKVLIYLGLASLFTGLFTWIYVEESPIISVLIVSGIAMLSFGLFKALRN